MKTASCKAKGRNLQKLVVQSILQRFPDLGIKDVRSTSMGATGVDVLLSETAYQMLHNLVIECKNQEKVNIWTAYEQAESHMEEPSDRPCLIIKRNNTNPLAVISLNNLLDIIYASTNTTTNS